MSSTSWFKCEELINDCLDFTVFEEDKRDQALKNRLVGDAEMYKRIFDRANLKTADVVKYFTSSVWSSFDPSKKSWKDSQVDRNVFIAVETLENSWMDMLPMST